MNFFESLNDFVSTIISDNNFEVFSDLERQTMFLPVSFFQLLPTSFNQKSILISQKLQHHYQSYFQIILLIRIFTKTNIII